jgi:hypothetical protein
MSIQTRAILRTLGMIAIAALGPIAVVALFQLDGETLFNLFILTIFAWMIWVIYSINLSQLETEEKVREMQERRELMISNVVKDPE